MVDIGLQVVEHNGHATATDGQERHVVDGTGVQGACVAMVLDAVQRLSAVPIQDIYADVNGLKASSFLLLAVAPTGRHDSENHVTITRVLQLL